MPARKSGPRSQREARRTRDFVAARAASRRRWYDLERAAFAAITADLDALARLMALVPPRPDRQIP